MKVRAIATVGCAAGIAVMTACGTRPEAGTGKSAPAAKVDNPKPESALTSVTLTADAEAHLALRLVTASVESVALLRTVGGEVVVPPGRAVVVSAPVAGTLARPAGGARTIGPVKKGDALFELVPLQQAERDVAGQAERDLQEADIRLALASKRLARVEALVKDGSTSVRSVEEARADRDVAEAAATAARRRLASMNLLPLGQRYGQLTLLAPFDGFVSVLRAAEGQTVAAGSPVADLVQTEALWVRVPVFAGDLASLDAAAPAAVAALGQEASGPWRVAQRVTGPPSADAAASTVDLFFALPSTPVVRPGERLAVRLSLRSRVRALVVPHSAVIYDVSGGSWVYERTAPHVFVRRRVELGGLAGSNVIVQRGLAEGQTVVAVGAAELYGTEFFVSK